MPDRYHRLAGRIIFARGVPLVTRPPVAPAPPPTQTPAPTPAALTLADGSALTLSGGTEPLTLAA